MRAGMEVEQMRTSARAENRSPGASLRGHVLLVDDDPELRDVTAIALRARGHTVATAASGAEAIEAATTTGFDVVLADLHLPGEQGLELYPALLAVDPTVPIVAVTADVTLGSAVAAMRAGAFDYLTKPVRTDLLALTIARALEHRRLATELSRAQGTNDLAGLDAIVGTSAAIRHVRDVIRRIAPTTSSVVITGESGTGKELVARAIHTCSPRASGPFVAINCAALPAELLESELFGHVRGAFTDARNARRGLFVEAGGGTLFLDEIGDMPLAMQVKLLRALQERTVRPVGGSAEIPFDARVIAATNRELARDVAEKRFREDLYYRINVVTVAVPPLRQRRDDIPVLAGRFLRRFAAQQGKEVRSISPAATQRLMARSWPGNVRELENAMERAVSMAASDVLGAEAFADAASVWAPGPPSSGPSSILPRTVEELVTADAHEMVYVHHVLSLVGGNKSRAADVLGYDRRTLHRKLRRATDAAAHAASGAWPISPGAAQQLHMPLAGESEDDGDGDGDGEPLEERRDRVTPQR